MPPRKFVSNSFYRMLESKYSYEEEKIKEPICEKKLVFIDDFDIHRQNHKNHFKNDVNTSESTKIESNKIENIDLMQVIIKNKKNNTFKNIF